MSHIFFLSYARDDRDPYLDEFFEDLCREVAGPTPFKWDDSNVSFRDTTRIPVMEDWQARIENALQFSAVLVCMTSVKYFNSEFCGKEYYVFDQRRRQSAAVGEKPPQTILPVVWWPVIDTGLPPSMSDTQVVPEGIPPSYLNKGLRFLRRFDRNSYDQCVTALADAIRSAWRKYPKIKPLANVKDFPNIPNAFADGDWQEAAEPGGWKRGPEVANFVFVAGTEEDLPEPPGRYGGSPADWRPYLPPERTTVLNYAQMAKKKQFLFREIRGQYKEELAAAKERLNLSVIIGSHDALGTSKFEDIREIERLWWDGMALLVPCSEPQIDEHALRLALRPAFPVLSAAQDQNFIGPIRTQNDLLAVLDATLLRMRNAVVGPEIDKKKRTDEPPPSINGVSDAPSP